MTGINKAIIIGNVGQDPETRSFPDGGSVTNISVATSEKWKDKQTGQDVEKTEWHRIVFKNRLAEIAAQYLRKGSKVYVEGKLVTRKWQNQQGVDQYTTEIHALQMQMLDGKSEGGQAPAPQQQQQAQQAPQQGYQQQAPNPQSQPPQQAPANNYDDFDDDIPF